MNLIYQVAVNFNHRFIMLNRAIEREESDAILPERSVQRHSATSLETARSLANGPSWGGGLREKYAFYVPQELQRFLSLFCLWADLNGGEASLHWKANILSLFSIMTL